MKQIWITLLLLLSGTTTCASIEPITSCEAMDNARPLCGWRNPEDMVALPDGRHVIVSEHGGMDGERAGTLSLLDLKNDGRRVLYRGITTNGPGPWGDPTCAGAPGPAFSPHGMDLRRRTDGRLQLLVVQHGGRESVEMFEVRRGSRQWRVFWRGCVIGPPGSMLNDIVADGEGGFFVTHMMPRRSSAIGKFFEFAKANFFGMKTGYVLAWKPGRGFRKLAGSEGVIANGITISRDSRKLYVAYSLRGELRRIDVATGRVEKRNTDLPPLDNVTWSPDGRLLVAGALAGPMEMMGCMDLKIGTCPGAFVILSLDPDSLAGQVVYKGGPGTPGGAGTVGLGLSDGTLLIGTFAGDRIVRASYSPLSVR